MNIFTNISASSVLRGGDESIHGESTGSILKNLHPKLFETTSSENFIIFSLPNIRTSNSPSWGFYYSEGDESHFADVQSMRLVFSLNHGKFIGDGREYTTSLGNLEVEVYAYDNYGGSAFHYNYSVNVTNAAMKLDRFELKDGNCDKLICSGSFIIDSELLICDKDGNELARVPFNLTNGSFNCTPIP